MSNKEQFISKRLREVWDWKEAIYQEVADLPVDQALREILEKARTTAEKYDLARHSPSRAFSRQDQEA